MPLVPKSIRLDELAKLHALREQGALTDEEFDREKAKLFPDETAVTADPRPANIALVVLAISAIVLVLVVIGTVAIIASKPAPAAVTYAPPVAATISNTTEVALPDVMPSTFTADQLATAFATIYPHGAKEVDAGGVLEFTPKRLLPVQGDLIALVSSGVRDGGQAGGACHACTGALRIDFVRWSNASFELAAAGAGRFTEAGAGWGEPPQWKVAKGQGLPVLRLTTDYAAMGCVNETVTLLKLTPAGVAKTNQTGKEDCSAATPITPEGS